MDEILLVEETSLFSELYVRTLKNAGYRVTLASTGFEAGFLLKQKPWDLVLLDFQLPDMHGLDLLRHIRAEPEAPGVLAIVASTAINLAIEAMHLGAEDFLVRPFPAERLAVSVRNVLESRRLAAELRRFGHIHTLHIEAEMAIRA